MKILHSIFYSFFKTIGRIFAYLIIGFLLAIVCSKFGINLDFILPVKVDALTTITPSDYGHKVEYVEYITQLQRTVQSDWIKGDLTNFCTGRCYLTKDWYYVKLNQSLNPGITYTWNFNTWITNRDNQNYYNKPNLYMIASNTGKYEGSSSANVTNLTCRAGIEEGSTSKVSWSCSFTPTTPINYLYLRITLYNDTDKLFTSYGCNKGTLLNDNAQIDAINNQTGVIKDQTDKINDTLNDSDISESNSEFNSFFNNFDTGDTGSLMNLINLPLTYLENLRGTCKNVNLPLPYFGNVQLQCMSTSVYNQNNDLKPIFVLVKLLINGIICYKCLKGLIYFIKDLKEPEKDNLEVLDL